MSRAQDLFESLYEVLHFESANVKTDGRSGIEATRNLFNVRRSQHSAIRQRSGIFICYNCGTQNMLARAEACHGVHGTTGQSPFKVTFGEEPRIGLESYVLPKSLVDDAKT
ncbi:conserved hypothetical protein [Trichinella spiralis]|uniref:hypothetical protein n=1 Tax=Trichinella spiralis TaxID=6334 RepID=UPI0001EFDA03|nr:conserved hypothetical protein [Trichinella spiralis]